MSGLCVFKFQQFSIISCDNSRLFLTITRLLPEIVTCFLSKVVADRSWSFTNFIYKQFHVKFTFQAPCPLKEIA